MNYFLHLRVYKNFNLWIFGCSFSFLLFLYGINFILLRRTSYLIEDHLVGIIILLFYLCLIFYGIKQYTFFIKKELSAISILLFFSLILISKPFLHPPSDPIYHADLLWGFLTSNENKSISRILFSLINYIYKPINYLENYQQIKLLHYLSEIMMVTSIYISGRLYGLNRKWAFFSVFISIFFFGTSYFSYFSYYSLASSSFNLSLIWLFSALFFNAIFKNDLKKFFYSMLIAVLMIPIIYISHVQEAAFLIYILMLSLFVYIIKTLKNNKIIGILILLYIFFPIQIVYYFFNSFFKISITSGLENNYLIKWGLWYFPNINGARIKDTLGLSGFLPLILAVPFLFIYSKKYYKLSSIYRQTLNSFIPGLLPFWMVLIPTNLFIWSISIYREDVFWRFCYISQFWITITFILQFTERHIRRFYKCLKQK